MAWPSIPVAHVAGTLPINQTNLSLINEGSHSSISGRIEIIPNQNHLFCLSNVQ